MHAGFAPEHRQSILNEAHVLIVRDDDRPEQRVVAAEEGDFEIPAISYAFFDPDSNRYKTMTTKPVRFRVSGETVKEKVVTEKKKSVSSINTRASWVAGSIVAALFLAVFGYWLLRKKEPVVVKAEETLVVEPSADEQLQVATQLAQHNDPAFYNELHRVIWEKLGHYFGLEGINLNKAALYSKLVEKEISPEMTNTINHILTECETNLYTTAALESNKEQLLADARKVLASLA
mgnify:CR=1 FL=1